MAIYFFFLSFRRTHGVKMTSKEIAMSIAVADNEGGDDGADEVDHDEDIEEAGEF